MAERTNKDWKRVSLIATLISIWPKMKTTIFGVERG